MNEINHIGSVLTRTLTNNNLDEVVLVVVGLTQESNLEFSFSATEASPLVNQIRRILIDLPNPYQAKLSKHYEFVPHAGIIEQEHNQRIIQ